jgi:RNase P subunit RPR2
MPLRFRYTTYMGEQHPAEKKVVVEFCTEDMRDLTPAQREKLQKLAGVRYNPETDIIKMSCEMFESQVQNKRYLGDLVEDLLRETKVWLQLYPSSQRLFCSNCGRILPIPLQTCPWTRGTTASRRSQCSPKNGR